MAPTPQGEPTLVKVPKPTGIRAAMHVTFDCPHFETEQQLQQRLQLRFSVKTEKSLQQLLFFLLLVTPSDLILSKGCWYLDPGSTNYLVNCHKLNGQGFSTLLGNGVAVTLLEAPSCLDGCHHGKEWRAPSGHEWTGGSVSKWWQSWRTTVQSLNYGSWLIVVTSFIPIFWTSVTILCCRLEPRRLWWNSSVVVRRAMNASKAVARFA